MRATLYAIERQYGSHCCGEGGEFETLTLDCPLFRRARLNIGIVGDTAGNGGATATAVDSDGRLPVPPPEVIITSPDPFAPSGHLVGRCRLTPGFRS